MNIEFARRVAKRLRDIPPELYTQEVWATQTACGTACCVAGHTVLEGGYSVTRDKYGITGCRLADGEVEEFDKAASRLLGFGEQNGWHPLFDQEPGDFWPEPFCQRWRVAEMNDDGTAERFQDIAADYLDHLCDEAEKAQ